MKLTRIILIISALVLAGIKANSQQSTSIAPDLATTTVAKVISFLEANPEVPAQTNITFIPYVSHAKGLIDSDGRHAEWGGGIAMLYPVNQYVKVGPRLQYLAGEFYLPSMNVTLSSAYKPVKGFTLTPAVWSGIAAPIGGAGAANRDALALYGAGLSLKYDISDKWTAGLAWGTERWTSLNAGTIDHFGVIFEKRF